MLATYFLPHGRRGEPACALDPNSPPALYCSASAPRGWDISPPCLRTPGFFEPPLRSHPRAFNPHSR